MAQLTLELCFRVAFLSVLLPLASGACVDLDLGVRSGTIPDSDITASSIQSVNTPAKNGRLNYTSGSSWCAGTSDLNPYLQIDLQTPHIICAVSTQGNYQADQWVKNYTLRISTDGTTWTDYKEDGQVKFLRGNDDRNSEVKYVVYGVLTRYLRFLPQIHQGGVCMRTEVFGVEQKPTCEMEAIGLAFNGKIPDNSFTATSFFNSVYEPRDGRLNANGRGWGPLAKNDPKDYLQIDLLFEYVICAVATQGSEGYDEWTTKYKIYLSLDGTNFFTYNETGVEKVFTGNTDGNTTKKNSLQEFASAKFIRFQPTAYHTWKVLRVEAYGVLLTKVPSQPPTAFNLTASSSTSITASWHLPPNFARHGRDITGFKLFYRQKDLAGCFSFLNITGASTLSRLVTGLEKYTEYELQVLAYTSDGDGPKSFVEVERTMEDVPSRPPSTFYVTATSTTVTASWQLPPVDSRNGIIKGFKVFYKRKDSSGSGNIILIISNSTLNKNVTGLNKYTEYEFQVLAFTSVGDGPKSSVVVRRTREDVPSQPPGGFNLTASTSTSITASWQLPPEDSRNGVITGYKLFYKKRGISGPASMQSINNQATRTQEVTGLHKFTEYEFQILAFTSVGDGPKSTAIFEKTKEAAPSGPPSQFIVTVNSLTSVTASWNLPPEDSRHGIIRGYKLFYKKKDSGLATSLTIDNGKTSKRVTNLDKYTEYEFQVLAFTSVGNGPNTSSVFTTTMEDVPPRIIEELSPSTVMCQKQTPCFLSCQATSYIPFNYFWTKDGQLPTGDNIKSMNNSLIVTPQVEEDYGEYVCHVTNTFGSTLYEITLLESEDTQNIFLASVIPLSCIVFVLLLIICGLIWQRRRAVNRRIQSKEEIDVDGVKSSPDQQSSNEQASDPNTYMELKPRPSTQKSCVPSEYQSLQEKPEIPGYYNAVLQKKNGGKQNEEVCEEI